MTPAQEIRRFIEFVGRSEAARNAFSKKREVRKLLALQHLKKSLKCKFIMRLFKHITR